jgi:hypothetical protein
MPRDDWAKARARDISRKAERRNDRSTRRSIARSKAAKKRHVAEQRLQSMSTRFWFGRHGPYTDEQGKSHPGKTVRQVTYDDFPYIQWLVRQQSSTTSQQMTLFIKFLKGLRPPHSPSTRATAPAADMRGDEAPVTSNDAGGKSVARALGTSADPDFDQVFEATRCAND